MIKNSETAKVIAAFAGLTMVLSVAAIPAKAQTVAELTAQINSLLATIAQLQAQLSTVSGGSAGSAAFTANLTVGSTGADVTALQNFLVSKGFLVMPAGVAMGYFGPLTQSALAKFQAANGISPASGYFGPITRTSVNGMMGGTTGGTTTGGTTTGTGIATPGAEGTITVSLAPSPAAGKTVYEGDTKTGVIGIKVEASYSDVSVGRIKLNLGSTTSIYTKVFSTLYVMDGSKVLTTVDLNSDTVQKEGSSYYVTITGFNFLVKEGETRYITIAADLMGSIKSADTGSKTITVPVDGVRAPDGAGINVYGPSTAFDRSVTVAASLIDSAELQLSVNSDTPDTGVLVADEGSTNDELSEATVLVFDLKAKKDSVKVIDLNVAITDGGAGGAATSDTAYLYVQGQSEPIATASITTDTAVFSNIDYVIAQDATKTFTVKVDFSNADGTAETFVGTATTTGITAENSQGSTVTKSGSATGNTLSVYNEAPIFQLLSVSAPTKGLIDAGSSAGTSTLAATFNVKVTAQGGDMYFGTVASATPMFGTSTTYFKVYQGGAASTLLVASSTSYSISAGGGVVTSGVGANSFKLTEGASVTIPVTFLFEGKTTAGVNVSTASYAIGLEGIKWSPDDGATTNTSTFMAGLTSWRSSAVTMP